MHELKRQVNEGIEGINNIWHEAIKDSQSKNGELDLSSVIVEQAKIRSKIDGAFMDFETRTQKKAKGWF